MNGPRTYAEWLTLLDPFRSGDDSGLKAMQNGSIEWTNIVAERWTRQVCEALTARLQALSKQLQTGLDRARGDASGISNALLGARRALGPLRAFVSLPCLPEGVRNHLEAELNRWITETQNSLERHAAQVRHDQGRLLKTIRDHPLGAVSVNRSSPPDAGSNQDPIPPVRGRRIIL